MKGYLVVPQEERWGALQPSTQLDCEQEEGPLEYVQQQRETLAASRVTRDTLMREMEAILMQEAELYSSLELLDYMRHRCAQQHDEIVERLGKYERVLKGLETRAATDSEFSHPVENLLNNEERSNWKKTKEMVTLVLPEVLTRLEDNIDLNNDKIRDIRDEMEGLRAKRLKLREDIATKEENIALLLKKQAFY